MPIEEIEQDFPGLETCEWSITSDVDDGYNCVAWAVHDTRQFSCGSAARCAEAAMPFRTLRDFLLGYAPLVWRCGKLSKLRHCALILDPEAQGRSPKIKASFSEGHSRFRTSGGRAAKNSFGKA